MRLLGGNDRHVQATPAPAPTGAPFVVTVRSKEIAIKSDGLYLWVASKFTPAMGFTFGWVALSVWISGAWVGELEQVTGMVLAWTIVILVVYLPGAVVAFLEASLILDRQPPLHVEFPTTALTAIIAAPNEERGIGEGAAAISGTDCAGPVTVILADHGPSLLGYQMLCPPASIADTPNTTWGRTCVGSNRLLPTPARRWGCAWTLKVRQPW
jgi:hypothetical protein